jgi:stearoyl-CoA desaturase (delta-9 desaturase)
LINSAAHVWGKQTYGTTNSSKDSGWLAFFTFGEGYHNFHHAFQADYRNGIKWWQWDPSKWWIRAWSILRLNSNLKKAPRWSIETAKMNTKFESTAEKSQSKHAPTEMTVFETRSKECVDAMRETLRLLATAREQLRKASATTRKNIANQISQAKKSIKRINSDFKRLLDEMMQSPSSSPI